MSNGTKESEQTEVTKEDSFTNIVERFTETIKKFKIKGAEVVADHCSKGNLEDLEDVAVRMREMNVHPSLVTQFVNFWSDEIQQEVPERLKRKMEREAGIKTTGSEEDKDRIYTVDADTGIIRLAGKDEKATTLAEATKLQKIIKKDLEEARKTKKKEAEEETGEPPFVVGEEGKWTLNPKGKIGFGEFAVFQMYQESLRRGEPIDPIEELARREESSARLKEAMGVKGEDTEMTVIDKLQKLGILKTGEGDLTDVLGRLDAIGLLRKPDDEGRGTELNILDKLSSLGMLVKPGEAEGIAGQTIRTLEVEIKSLREALTKQEMDAVKGSLVSLSRSLEDLRKEMSQAGKLEGRYALMDKTISTIDSQLSGLRSDAKPLLEMVAGGAGPGPTRKSPEDRAKIAKGVKEAVALEREARDLEDELLFGSRQG